MYFYDPGKKSEIDPRLEFFPHVRVFFTKIYLHIILKKESYHHSYEKLILTSKFTVNAFIRLLFLDLNILGVNT